MKLNDETAPGWLDEIIENALSEDIGHGDITTDSIVDSRKNAKAVWIAKQPGTVSGLDVGKAVFLKLDEGLIWNPRFKEGDTVQSGDILVEFTGKCRVILTAERVALNFVQRMCGIATATEEMVRILDGLPASVLDTRKTVPGLRRLDKSAVKAGGGTNHRMGLYDFAMIKDNHIEAAGSIKEAVQCVRKKHPGIQIEVETTNINQVREALEAGADIIMLDNMDMDMMQQAVRIIGKNTQTEASGNISVRNLRQVAETGVDFISAGTLTHSVSAFDISQRITEVF